MERVYNFSAGPSMLPLPVLEKVQKEMLNYGGSGMSVMEMSHRSKWFDDIIKAAEATLRELMHIPDNYKVLFLQGGGSTQFAMVPLNLFQKGECVYESPSVMDIQRYCTREKDTIWDETKRFVNPQEIYVDLSDKLYEMKTALLNKEHM